MPSTGAKLIIAFGNLDARCVLYSLHVGRSLCMLLVKRPCTFALILHALDKRLSNLRVPGRRSRPRLHSHRVGRRLSTQVASQYRLSTSKHLSRNAIAAYPARIRNSAPSMSTHGVSRWRSPGNWWYTRTPGFQVLLVVKKLSGWDCALPNCIVRVNSRHVHLSVNGCFANRADDAKRAESSYRSLRRLMTHRFWAGTETFCRDC